MKKVQTILSLTLLLLGMSMSLSAQKVGYLDSYALFAEMPSVKSADEQLMSYEKQKMAGYEQKVKALESLYAQALKQQSEGTLTQVQQQTVSEQLNKGQQEILVLEQQIQQDLAKKRQELYEPILRKVDDAIKAVSKEHAYEMIFDTTSGILLYAEEGDDISKLVRAKLGY